MELNELQARLGIADVSTGPVSRDENVIPDTLNPNDIIIQDGTSAAGATAFKKFVAGDVVEN
jgi:hypothetical protein